jgi:ElaB/YqjD/DUF883 family membrane-anchored ribosome-binding protein
MQENEMVDKNRTGADYAAGKAAARDTADKAGQFADRAAERAGEAYDEVAARAQEAGNVVRDYAGKAADTLDDSIHNRPMATLLGAVAVGFVVGALWKS